MSDLAKKSVFHAKGIILHLISEIHKYLKKVDGWDVLEDKKILFFYIKI